MNIPSNILSTLTDDQKRRVEAARTAEDLRVLAKEAGMELSPEQLELISGGGEACWLCSKECGMLCITKNA